MWNIMEERHIWCIISTWDDVNFGKIRRWLLSSFLISLHFALIWNEMVLWFYANIPRKVIVRTAQAIDNLCSPCSSCSSCSSCSHYSRYAGIISNRDKTKGKLKLHTFYASCIQQSFKISVHPAKCLSWHDGKYTTSQQSQKL